mmetsp:Transcript_31520/g.28714  ORF Transcript_31520/g.28714 Transcript_31520/m.28714 type:complete len:92 (+) Transcript_31520:74-349(+)
MNSTEFGICPGIDPSKVKTFDDIELISKLSDSHYDVHLAFSKLRNKYLVMKIFPHQDNQPTEAYRREMVMTELRHPNLITCLQYKEHEKIF